MYALAQSIGEHNHPFILYNAPFHSSRNDAHLRCGGRLRVDVRAEESLAEKRQDAALGLLALSGASGDEVVDRGWRRGSLEMLARMRVAR